MARNGRIDEIYDIDSVDDQHRYIIGLVKEFTEAAKATGKVKIQLGEAKGVKETVAGIKALNAEQLKLAEIQNKLAASEDKLAAARLKNSRANTEDIKTQKQQIELKEKLARQQEKLLKVSERELKAIEKNNNAYIKLNEQYKIAAAASLKRGAELQREANGNEALFRSLLKTDREYQSTTKSANQYNQQLLQLEQAVGRSQRNVGNYASAFSGLNNSFAQISRELPALAINFQTFALAISNNLPIAIDEIGRARAEIAKLKAEGQAAPSLFSKITGAIFSWQVAMSIAITAFVLFSKEISTFFKEIFKGKTEIDQLKQSTETLNKAFEESSVKDAVKNVFELTANVKLAKEGFIDKEKVIKQYNETMGKTTGEVKTLDGVEKTLVKNGPAYIQMMLFKAAAMLALKEASEKTLEAQKNQLKSNDEFVSDVEQGFNALNRLGTIGSSGTEKQADINNEKAIARAAVRSVARKRAAVRQSEEEEKALKDIAAKFFERAGRISKDFNFDFFGGDFEENNKDSKKRIDILRKNAEDELRARRESIIAALEENADLQNRFFEDESNSYAVRLKAAENFYLVRDAIASANKTTELIELKKKQEELKLTDEQVAEQRLLIDQKYASEVLKNTRANAEAVTKIQKEQLAEADRLRSAYEANEIKRIEDSAKRNKTILEKERDEQLLELENQFSDGLIKRKEYESEKERIQTEFNAKSLQVELQYFQDLIAFLDSIGADVTAAEAKLAELRLKLKKDTNEKLLKSDKEYGDKLRDLLKELQQGVFQLTKEFTLGRFDEAKNKIQDQIEATEEQKRKEIDAINATTLSAQEKAARITNAEKKAQAERERLELRQRQLDQQRARFERAFSIAQIIGKTAEAIAGYTKGLPITAPLIALSAAIGATQIASVLAKPIPRFKTGKGQYDDYEGPAWVGDGGKSEMIFREDGTVERTPSTPVMTWVGKNDIVHPDADAWLNRTLKNQGEVYPYNMAAMFAFGEMTSTLQGELKGIRSEIRNKREWIVNLNNGKPSIMAKDGTTTTRYLNDNLQFGK